MISFPLTDEVKFRGALRDLENQGLPDDGPDLPVGWHYDEFGNLRRGDGSIVDTNEYHGE